MYSYISMTSFLVTMFLYPSSTTQMTGNVLILSLPGYSRWISAINIARELQTYGYNATFVLPEGKETLVTDIGAETIISEGMTKVGDILLSQLAPTAIHNRFKGKFLNIFQLMRLGEFCALIAGDDILMETLRKRNFDIAIIDTGAANLCTSTIPYRLSIPFIHFGWLFQVQNMRIPIHPAAYPAAIILSLTDKMTYFQRLYNTILHMILSITPNLFTPSDVVSSFAPDKPYISNEELQARTELYLLDTDELIDYHLPTYPNTMYVGGLATSAAAPLTGDLRHFLDSAEDGAVLVSFGTLVTTIPEYTLDTMIQAFRKRPNLKFIFKYGSKTSFHGNVMQMPWLPQNDVLGHPNLKMFISQCGNNGQFEALYHAVPILCLPTHLEQI